MFLTQTFIKGDVISSYVKQILHGVLNRKKYVLGLVCSKNIM